MEWVKIHTQTDADELIEVFGGFHDACIREAHLWTDSWVSPDLSMSCGQGLDHKIQFLVQRQIANPSAIELLFEQVMRFNLVPPPENHDSIIQAVTLIVDPEMVFWSLDAACRPDSSARDVSTWLSAKSLCWRQLDWLGENLRYQSHS